MDRLRRAVLASPGDVGGVFARMTQFGPDAQPHLVDHIVGLAGRARTEVWTDGLAGLMEMDLRHALPRVRVPAIVIVGQHDRVTPPATAVELVGDLPDATLVVVEYAGHMAMLERPAEVNHDIRVFARSCFAAAAPANVRRAPRTAAEAPKEATRKTAPEKERRDHRRRGRARRTLDGSRRSHRVHGHPVPRRLGGGRGRPRRRAGHARDGLASGPGRSSRARTRSC